MIKKLFITPWFGPLPAWWDQYRANAEPLGEQGYDWLVTTNLEDFKARIKRILGVEAPIVAGGTKVHDFRPALGSLFVEELKGYDYWGFTDFDCIYGRVEHWITDEFLGDLDVHSDCPSYICGPWTLFKNSPTTRELFRVFDDWQKYLEVPETTAWVEHSFSRLVEDGMLLYEYTGWHSYNRICPPDQVRLDGRKLFAGENEVPMFHFRDSKQWPIHTT